MNRSKSWIIAGSILVVGIGATPILLAGPVVKGGQMGRVISPMLPVDFAHWRSIAEALPRLPEADTLDVARGETIAVTAHLTPLGGASPTLGIAVPTVPNSLVATVPAPAYPVAVFDRATLPAGVGSLALEKRRTLIAALEDPHVIRFSIPRAKAYFDGIVRQLLFESALLDRRMEPLRAYLNDSSWGMPTASLRNGVLSMDAEAIEVMGSEDEIAAILAHEIAHHVRAHTEQIILLQKKHPPTRDDDIFSAPQLSEEELKARWSHELEADALSLRILANARYDPSSAIDALLSVRREMETEPRYEFHRGRNDGTHPPTDARIRYLGRVMAQDKLQPRPRTNLGLAEVQEELADRRRPFGGPSARELYQRYRPPLSPGRP